MSFFQQQSPKQKMATPKKEPINIPPTKTTLSSFLSIGNSHPTTTIEVHKLVCKSTIRRPNNKTENKPKDGNTVAAAATTTNNKRRWSRPRISSPKSSGFKALFGNKKKESPFTKTKEVSGNLEGKGKQPIGYDNDEKIGKQSSKNNYKKVHEFLAGIFDRKCSFSSTTASRSKLYRSSSSISTFPRFPFTSREIDKNYDMENEAIERVGKGRVKREESSREGDLCKKRILMGEKCRPLTSSGILHYDVNGLLLIED